MYAEKYFPLFEFEYEFEGISIAERDLIRRIYHIVNIIKTEENWNGQLVYTDLKKIEVVFMSLQVALIEIPNYNFKLVESLLENIEQNHLHLNDPFVLDTPNYQEAVPFHTETEIKKIQQMITDLQSSRV